MASVSRETALSNPQNDVRLFKSLLDLMNDGALIVDNSECIMYSNRRFQEITGYSKEELQNKVASKLLVFDRTSFNAKGKTDDRIRGISETYEVQLIRKTGDLVWTRVSASPIMGQNNNIIGSIGLHVDITEQKISELALKNVLAEKEMLLKEIHHRVKHNLQFLSSLLSVKADGINSKEQAIKAFTYIKNSIQSMALIHETAYLNLINASIDAKSYFETLFPELQQTLSATQKGIRLHYDMDTCELSPDKAITCGMLVNELLTNSVEHAPENGVGEISVRIFHSDGDSNQMCIEYNDDGKGTVHQAQDNGMEFIAPFTDKLQARVVFNQGPNTSCHIYFTK